MRTRKPETTESVRRNDLRSVVPVAREGLVAGASTVEGGLEGSAKSCLRILAPIRVLGRERGDGALAKVGAISVQSMRHNERREDVST
jgi:hypothetical protein